MEKLYPAPALSAVDSYSELDSVEVNLGISGLNIIYIPCPPKKKETKLEASEEDFELEYIAESSEESEEEEVEEITFKKRSKMLILESEDEVDEGDTMSSSVDESENDYEEIKRAKANNRKKGINKKKKSKSRKSTKSKEVLEMDDEDEDDRPTSIITTKVFSVDNIYRYDGK